ncbi:RecQ family ATP-dependent DNA helicase [Rubritalea marina]|uniref:RecQ family ATP-dependent DNA helicase n=1 Tax=Rubritalea marina TaxID=361055 RepID=UPI0014614BAA|nr:RecQ family ATP-dependent DNA helicase [Rubritalea marina]
MIDEPLKHYFGHDSFRPLQREVIESVLQGTPSLAIFPTGAGKSLTYQLPAQLLPGTTLVIAPLISLIADQVESLRALDTPIPVGHLDSTLSPQERAETLELLRQGAFKIFYTSPESLANPALLSILKQLQISLAVVDEAHCISSWGQSFRPSYLYLPKLLRQLKPHATLALTATATRKTASEIRRHFKIKQKAQFNSPIHRPNLSFTIHPVSSDQRNAKLLDTLRGPHTLPAIVYVTRQEDTEQLSHFLTEHGFESRAFHAGMSNGSRKQVQAAFMDDLVEVIVCTIAFGMGVDKSNIRSVIHYHLPKSPEGWMQESGRAGRDGAPSQCTLLACGDDLITLKNFIHGAEIPPRSLTQLLEQLFSQGSECTLSPHQTRVQFDISPSTFSVIMAKLECSGAIRFTRSSWRYARAWPIAGQQFQLEHQAKSIQVALATLIEASDRVDTHALCEKLKLSHTLLWKHLHELADADEIKLIPSGWFWHYSIKKKPLNFIAKFTQEQSEWIQSEFAKLDEVVRIATSRACIARNLAKYFSHHDVPPCGHCSSCKKDKRPKTLPSATPDTPSETELREIQELLKEKAHRIHSTEQLTRFLCGIHSSRNRQYYLHHHKHFGLLARLPYTEVHAYAKVAIG